MKRLLLTLALLAAAVPARAGFFGPFTALSSSPTWSGSQNFLAPVYFSSWTTFVLGSSVTVNGDFKVGVSTLVVTQARVGIGWTPSYLLDVRGAGQAVESALTSTHASGYPALQFFRNSTTQIGVMQAGL